MANEFLLIAQIETEEAVNDIERIEETILNAGKLLGAIPLPNRNPEQLFNSGHWLVISGCDTILLQTAAEADVNNIRKAGKR